MAKRVREDPGFIIRPEWLNLLPIVAAILAASEDIETEAAVEDALILLESCTEAAEDL